MDIKSLPLYLFLLVLAAFPGCMEVQEPEIAIEDSARIVKTLSSDDMKGRHAFSPEIKKAADFIASEFNRIGLKPLPDENDYHQDFQISSLQVDTFSIKVDGRELSNSDFFVLMDSEKLNWSHTQNRSVAYISAGDDYRKSIHKYRHDDKETLVVVDPAHREIFYRYRNYYSKPNHTFKLGDEKNDVFILGEGIPDSYTINIENSVLPHDMFNIAGQIPGKRDDEIILFSAHYDHIGVMRPVESDSIGNGANDNASGISAIIQLARYFQDMPTPERTLYFVAFTGEEVGGFGSRYFAQQTSPEDIIAMFNIEMIGKAPLDGPNAAWITGYDLSNFGELLKKHSPDSVFYFYADPYTNLNLFYRSDNITLARHGVPAHTISTTPLSADNDYHTPGDEFETLDIQHLNNTIKAIARASKGMVNGEDTPTRIDTAIFEGQRK